MASASEFFRWYASMPPCRGSLGAIPSDAA